MGLNPDGDYARPKDIGYVENFVKIDSCATEQLWGNTETNIHYVLKAIRAQTLFQNPKLIALVRDLVALHYTRSHEVLRESENTYANTMRRVRADIMNQPSPDPTISDLSERRIAANNRMAELFRLHKRGVIFRFRIADIFEGAKEAVANAGVRLLRPEAGSEFLIADAPVIVSAIPGQRHSISSGVPIGNACEAYLPLGPKLAVVVDLKGHQNGFVEINSDLVERYNRWEVEAAVHDVIMRPGSYLERFPESVNLVI